MNDKVILISDKFKIICEKLNSLGYKLIYTENVGEFISYEQKHADMQCISVNNQIFVLKNCENLKNKISKYTTADILKTDKNALGDYPNNILLNAKIITNNLIGKIDSLDNNLKKYCIERGYNLINVKQGYSGCSILKVTENSVITTDESIYRTLKNTDIDVLKISQNGIVLYDSKRGEQGLIGGASMNLGDKILFFGDITKHQDYENIKKFCREKNISIEYIESIKLTDIGGGILLNISQ